MFGPRRTFAAALQAGRLSGFPIIPLVLELYSGTARFSAAASRAGYVVLCFDWSFGPEFDLSRPAVQSLILGRIRAGYVCFLLVGIPCQSWSRARMRPGGPQMLRDLQYLLGLPTLLYESERPKIVNGTTMPWHSHAKSRTLSSPGPLRLSWETHGHRFCGWLPASSTR